jgi:hypothetical protein
VLTAWSDQPEHLGARTEKFAKNIMVLRGSTGTREPRASQEVLRAPEPQGKASVLDRTVFFTNSTTLAWRPSFWSHWVFWKGILADVGRISRDNAARASDLVYSTGKPETAIWNRW